MTDWGERAFDGVAEITKQVLTLATGITALSITFFKDFATHATPTSRTVMAWSWVAYGVSIVFGVLTLMASAGVQQDAADKGTTPTINAGNLRVIGGLQLGTFLIGIALTVAAGALAV